MELHEGLMLFAGEYRVVHQAQRPRSPGVWRVELMKSYHSSVVHVQVCFAQCDLPPARFDAPLSETPGIDLPYYSTVLCLRARQAELLVGALGRMAIRNTARDGEGMTGWSVAVLLRWYCERLEREGRHVGRVVNSGRERQGGLIVALGVRADGVKPCGACHVSSFIGCVSYRTREK